MFVEVHNNNVARAMRILNKKMKDEGLRDEMMKHRYYTKPSVTNREKRLRKKLG